MHVSSVQINHLPVVMYLIQTLFSDFPKVGQLFCVMIEEGMYDTVAWAKTAPDSKFSEITVGQLIRLDYFKSVQ